MFNDDLIQVLDNRLDNMGGNNMLLTTTYLQKDLKQTFYVHTSEEGFALSTVDITLMENSNEADEYIISTHTVSEVFNEEPTADTALYDYCYMMFLHEMYELHGDTVYMSYADCPPSIKNQITDHYKDWMEESGRNVIIKGNQ